MRDVSKWRTPWTILIVATFLSHAALAEQAHSPSRVSRNVQFSNITADAGLTSEFVHAVVQDGQGFLWFGTQSGLNRYDGHDITAYEHEARNPDSLSNSFIWTLHLDHEGDLWVGTNRGVNRYNFDTDSFERNPLGLQRNHRIRAIMQDQRGKFWLGTVDMGMLSVNQQTGEIHHYDHDPADASSLPSNQIMSIHEDRKGRLWVGTDGGGLARLDRATDSFVIYQHTHDITSSLSDDEVRSIYEDRSGNIWVGTADGGLSLYDDASGSFRHFRHNPEDPDSLSDGQVHSIFEDRKGTLWVGTETGLSEWRPAIQGFVHYTNVAGDSTSLVNNRINAMFQDQSGVLWLATHGGISSWNYFSDTFTYYTADFGFLENDVVTSIEESRDGVLWIGTFGGGLTRLDMSSGQVVTYRHDQHDDASLSDDWVMTVHIDQQDRIWAGTRSGGLNRWDAEQSRFVHHQHDADDPGSLSGNAITSIESAPDGTIWVGVFGGGLNRSTSSGGAPFERFQHDADDPTSLSNDRVLTIHRDQTGLVWVGTEDGGLNQLDPATDRFTRFSVSDSANDFDDSLGTSWEIVETKDGTFWIGTMSDGLLRWNAADRLAGKPAFERYTQPEGLASTIYGIVEGAMGELWVSSNRGLARFDTDTLDVRLFDRKNGLKGTEFNLSARLRSRTGRLLFGGNHGIVGFYPGELPQNRQAPKINVVARSRDELLTRSANDASTPQVEIDYLDPFIAFDFVALDFVSPDKNQYRYRLRGFDDEWTDADRFRRATYTNLPADSYVFEVQASNNDNVWNRQGTGIAVVVIPPPWERWWAYLGYALIIVGCVGWYLRNQRMKLRQDAELRAALEQQVQERTAEIATRNVELQSLNEMLAEASVTDSLTGLRNRRYVDQFIGTEISMVERRLNEGEAFDAGEEHRDSSKLLFFMMIDLDGFKAINDSYGHQAGDKVLTQVKEVLIGCCRKSDVVVRWGGDEFMIIGHATSFSGVKVLAERIRESLAERPYDVGEGRFGRISASIGVVPYPFCEDLSIRGDWEQISGIADQGAYIAKENGRNAWVSIRGTDLMTREDFLRAANELATLVDEDKLAIDSSVEGGPDLRIREAQQRIAANG